MPRPKKQIPSYLHFKPKNKGYCRVGGKNRYFPGPYNSAESKRAYSRFVAELTAAPQSLPSLDAGDITIAQLLDAFLTEHVEKRYVKRGRPTTEQAGFRRALRPVSRLYGDSLARDFGPLALIACRSTFVQDGICRKKCNTHTGRIVRCFKWGVSRQLVPETVWRALTAVEGITAAEMPDPPKIRPVTQEQVDAIKPFVTPQIWAMVQFQLHTGCRPQEACDVRTADLDRSREIWEYRPGGHKTEHHGFERVIFVGPTAQEILRPWLREDEPEACIWQPREARATFQERRRAGRRTKRFPCDDRRRSVARPRKQAGTHYTSNVYGKAILRACERAKCERWAPNQLRHLAGTRIRAAYGIEAARIMLGHSSAVTSEIYSEIDANKARRIARELG
jgi:integrase